MAFHNNSLPTVVALDLVRDLKRNSDMLPPYRGEQVTMCLNAINEMYARSLEILQQNESANESQLNSLPNECAARSQSIQFIFRCLQAYEHERLRRIKAVRWKFGGLLPVPVRSNLCDAEIEFFSKYSASLSTFQKSVGEGVNLLLSTSPPTELFVQVRVLQDYGEFETSDGNIITLNRLSIHNLMHSDCEILIRQGILELVNT